MPRMFIIRYLLNIVLSIRLISCLRWSSSGEINILDSPISLAMTSNNPAIDIYKGDQIIIIKDVESYKNEFVVYCMVAGYSTNSELVYRFCTETQCSPEWKESDPISNFPLFNFPQIIKQTNFPDRKGLKLTLSFPNDKIDASGNFHCEAQDNFGKFMIRSNDIQIQDIRFWSQNFVTNPENRKTIYTQTVLRSSVPLSFKCVDGTMPLNPQIPIWFKQMSISPVKWSVCPVKNNYQSLTVKEKVTFNSCAQYTTQIWSGEDMIKPRPPSDMNQWNQYVDNNGDLQIFRINIDSIPSPVTYALMCYIKVNGLAMPINTYISSNNKDDIIAGVQFSGSPPDYTIKLDPISERTQFVTLYARKVIAGVTPRVVSLIAQYKASSSVETYWKINGNQLNAGTNIKFDRYSVQFIGDITSDMAGNYTLDITDGAEKLTMTIVAVVAGPPTLTTPNCLPLVRFVMEFDSTNFTCIYKNRPQSLSLKINNEQIILGQSLDISRINLGKSYPYLSELNFTVSPIGYIESDVVTMTYSTFNLRKTLGQTQYQDHTVMFFVQNAFGLSVKSSSIYVVPRLKDSIDLSPELYNCTDACSSGGSYIFQCKIQIEKYKYRELKIDHYWTINNHRLEQNTDSNNQFSPYFTVDPVTKQLTLNPIKSNNTKRDNFVKDALKDNFIECHFDLISSPEIVPEFKYHSSQDSSLKNTLRARITLDYQPINSAYVYWIVAVILGLVIILLLIVLLTRYCMRNKGETYQLDKIERQHGYDPDKEVQEEMFKPYEREEHDLEIMPGSIGDRKLSITGHSVGSADDGELDNYDLDPSNFNENGSIIGMYGANPRNRTAMT